MPIILSLCADDQVKPSTSITSDFRPGPLNLPPPPSAASQMKQKELYDLILEASLQLVNVCFLEEMRSVKRLILESSIWILERLEGDL
jgi:hypothetical protein